MREGDDHGRSHECAAKSLAKSFRGALTLGGTAWLTQPVVVLGDVHLGRTYASVNLARGEDLAYVSKQLGRANPAIAPISIDLCEFERR